MKYTVSENIARRIKNPHTRIPQNPVAKGMRKWNVLRLLFLYEKRWWQCEKFNFTDNCDFRIRMRNFRVCGVKTVRNWC